MKKFLVIPILLTLFVFSACDRENEEPSLTIVNPEDDKMVMRGDVVIVEIEAEDEDGALMSVVLSINDEKVDTFTSTPMVYEWNTESMEVGEQTLYALATDDEGGFGSDLITVNMNVPGGFNPDLNYRSVNDYDGNTYRTIDIGEQSWMAENLKVTHFADGTPISEISGDDNWALLADEGAYCWLYDHVAYADTFGALYNFSAAIDPRGLCPDGWHLPSDAEWQQLEVTLGMSESTAALYDWRGSNEGGKLKEPGFTHWEIYNDSASNTSGYTALPGGFRSYNGSFNGAGLYAVFWTATVNPDKGSSWYRALHHEHGNIYRHYNNPKQGFSIRCVKD